MLSRKFHPYQVLRLKYIPRPGKGGYPPDNSGGGGGGVLVDGEGPSRDAHYNGEGYGGGDTSSLFNNGNPGVILITFKLYLINKDHNYHNYPFFYQILN